MSDGGIDLMGAAGLAGRRQVLGYALHHLLASRGAHDAHHVVDLLRAEFLKRGGARRPAVEVTLLLQTAVAVWLTPVCPVCEGRKFEVMRDAPVLTDRPCKACGGSGQRQLGLKGWELVTVEWARAKLELDHARFQRQVRNKLGRG